MIKVACDYNIKEDIGFILESEKINNIEFAERAKKIKMELRKKRKQAQDKNRLGLDGDEMEQRIQQRAMEAMRLLRGEGQGGQGGIISWL